MHTTTLQWRHNEHNGISNHQHLDCLLNHLFCHRSKKTSKVHITGLCEGYPLVTGGFPSQKASNMENIFIWWHHHEGFVWFWLQFQIVRFMWLISPYSSVTCVSMKTSIRVQCMSLNKNHTYIWQLCNALHRTKSRSQCFMPCWGSIQSMKQK